MDVTLPCGQRLRMERVGAPPTVASISGAWFGCRMSLHDDGGRSAVSSSSSSTTTSTSTSGGHGRGGGGDGGGGGGGGDGGGGGGGGIGGAAVEAASVDTVFRATLTVTPDGRITGWMNDTVGMRVVRKLNSIVDP